MKHNIFPHLLTRPVRVAVAGIGGTGSQILSGLARLHIAMKSTGHPHGLTVTAFDPDQVTTANVGRQLFYNDDVGRNKAEVLIERINFAYQAQNIEWGAEPECFDKKTYYCSFNIVIGCVDSRRSRKGIKDTILKHTSCVYYLDCGNGPDYGQVLIGSKEQDKSKTAPLKMPWEICPDLIADIPEDNTPSCSLAEALEHQELYVNQMTATLALQLLWSLFRRGGLDHQGYFFNLTTGRTVPVPIQSVKTKCKSNKAGGK